MKNVGRKITELRKQYNMSQEKLAELMDVSRQTVSRWEAYGINPSTDNVLALCKLFNVSSEYLLNDDLDNPEEAGSIIVNRTIPVENIIDIPDEEISQLNYINSLPYESREIAVSNQPSEKKKRHKFLWLLFWILSANVLVFGTIIGVCMFIIHYSSSGGAEIKQIHEFSDIPLLIFVIIALFLIITAIVILIYFIIAKKAKKKTKCKINVAEK